jgi:hypothetical protein
MLINLPELRKCFCARRNHSLSACGWPFGSFPHKSLPPIFPSSNFPSLFLFFNFFLNNLFPPPYLSHFLLSNYIYIGEESSILLFSPFYSRFPPSFFSLQLKRVSVSRSYMREHVYPQEKAGRRGGRGASGSP